MRGPIPQLTPTPSWRGAQLKHKDNFTFFLKYKDPYDDGDTKISGYVRDWDKLLQTCVRGIFQVFFLIHVCDCIHS